MLDRVEDIIAALRKLATPAKMASIKRVGIKTDNCLGTSVHDLRRLSGNVVHSRNMAEALWGTGIHEARLLAGMICPPDEADEALAEKWIMDFDSWDICDLVMDLFASTSFGWKIAVEWCHRPEEFVRRTGFGMFCWFAVHDRDASNTKFIRVCFPLIRKYATDDRNFVRKAVNWALRNIGKRNMHLNEKAIGLATGLSESKNKTARWVGKDALKELTSEKVLKRVAKSTKG
jgi:3-methyladenine DNA glycosylase AlkD